MCWKRGRRFQLSQIIPVPKLELPVFEGQKPQWWLRHCEKLFGIHQVVDHQRVALASAYLNDVGDMWF